MNTSGKANELIHETSPYLLQHAYNPVHWRAWSADTLKLAQTENKPLLVSIGYATCHWCHVMERESFENEEIAELMNQHFICIKIDREERPDLDAYFMEAIQLISGSGGWPLNCFCQPDGKPFFGGTYFPPEQRYGRPSWPQVLQRVANVFNTQRETTLDQTFKLTEAINNNQIRILNSQSDINQSSSWELKSLMEKLEPDFDETNGGFGSAPKFPHCGTVDLLQLIHHNCQNIKALAHAMLSMKSMIRGGIYDHLRGGFSRYTVDAAWLVPHFEKMLYDNALLLSSIAGLFKVTKDKELLDCAQETAEFLMAEMKSNSECYYAAIDADSEGVEGKFYVWSADEIEELFPEHYLIINAYFGVSKHGNWEETNILSKVSSIASLSKDFKIPEEEVENIIKDAKQILLKERNKRIRPITDVKCLFGWNALLLKSFAQCAAAFQSEHWRKMAEELFHAMKKIFFVSGTVSHHVTNGIPAGSAMSDDAAYWADACIELFQLFQDKTYLDEAESMAQYAKVRFDDADGIFFYQSEQTSEHNLPRMISWQDNATPSGNAIWMGVLSRLGILLEHEMYTNRSEAMWNNMEKKVSMYPLSLSWWAYYGTGITTGYTTIVITGSNAEELSSQFHAKDYPLSLLLVGNESNKDLPLVADKQGKEVGIYICKDYSCLAPVKTYDEAIQIL